MRIYWQALLAGQVQSHWDVDAAGFSEFTHLEKLASTELDRARADLEDGMIGEAVVEELEEALEEVRSVQQGSVDL